MSLTIQPARVAPADQVHGLSHHPTVQAILRKGADHLWTVEEVAELFGLAVRSVHQAWQAGLMTTTSYPTRTGGKCTRRRCTSASLLIYFLSHSAEVPQGDVLQSLALIVTQLTDAQLEQVEAACRTLRERRQNRPVLVIGGGTDQPAAMPSRPRAAAVDVAQLDLFAAPASDAA